MAEPGNPAAPDVLMEVEDTLIEVIDSQGDIIFVVGPKKKQVQVHSLTMMRRSPVFAKMLGPNFSEGQSLANRGTELTEIRLPEDDACAFIIICSTVHGITLDDMPDSKQLLDVAIMADKYDFIKSLRYTTQCWIQEFEVCERSDDLWRVLVSAYILDCAKGFQQTSRQLIFWHRGSYWGLITTTPRSESTALLAFAQAKVANEIEIEVIKIITHKQTDIYDVSCNICPYHTYQYGSLLKDYELVGFWQGLGKTSLGEQLQNLRDVTPEKDNPVKSKRYPKVIEMNGKIQARLTVLFDGIGGLCLESFKAGKIVGWTKLD